MKSFVMLCVIAIAACSAGPGADPGIGGANGANGDGGANGTNGVNGAGGTNGANGVGGANGSNGAMGDGGLNGEAGANGSNGAPGPAGMNGTDNHIVKTWGCDFTKTPFGGNTIRASNCSDGAVTVNVWYFAEEMSSGDTFIRAGVDDYPAGNGDSSTEFWRAGSWEADNGKNWLLHNVCSSGGAGSIAATGNWSFTLNKQAKVLTTTYTDSDIVGGVLTFTSSCQ